ncbi:MAG: sugar ABC transporter permease [Nitrospinota bacterium]|nr:MAG: sugar ABC transporter permease [Nitrospinota bacterium]
MFDATFSVFNWVLRWLWQMKLTTYSIFFYLGRLVIFMGAILVIRYFYLTIIGEGRGKFPSLILGLVMLGLGFIMNKIGLLPGGLVLKENWGYFKGPLWLGDPVLAMICIITVNTWRGIPFFAISFLAGLQTVPPDLYYAGDIDGANDWQKFWNITVPVIKPIAVVVIVFSLVVTFADFQVVYVLTRGGPSNSTHLFATLAYQLAMGSGNLGEGAAVALFMFPFLALVILWQLLYLRRESTQQ